MDESVAVRKGVFVSGTPGDVRVAVCVFVPIKPVGVMVMKYMPVAATRVAAPGSMVAPYTKSTAVLVG